MKKFFSISLFVVVAITMLVTAAYAKTDRVGIKGEVTAINVAGGSFTLLSSRGESVVVIAPVGFDLNSIGLGDEVLVRGTQQADGTLLAETIKVVKQAEKTAKEKEGTEDLDESDDAEGSKANSAYCQEGKKNRPHPLAVKIAERFGVSEALVMEYFCQGYGMGAIMLALMTKELNGADPAGLLAARKQGKGWGVIWQELGVISSQKQAESPPGWLKKPDKAGVKNK